MIIAKLFILLFTIHHICCTRAASSQSSAERNLSQILQLNTPDIFVITRPTNGDKIYNEFLNFLYRHDTLKVKSKTKREINWRLD